MAGGGVGAVQPRDYKFLMKDGGVVGGGEELDVGCGGVIGARVGIDPIAVIDQQYDISYCILISVRVVTGKNRDVQNAMPRIKS